MISAGVLSLAMMCGVDRMSAAFDVATALSNAPKLGIVLSPGTFCRKGMSGPRTPSANAWSSLLDGVPAEVSGRKPP